MPERSNQQIVNDWISENFDVEEIEIKDCPLFPAGKILTDKNGEKMVVFYDIMRECVQYRFAD